MSNNSRLPCYQARREIEDRMALVVDCDLAIGVIVIHARGIGHRAILEEVYRAQRDLNALTQRLSNDWQNQTMKGNEQHE